MIIETYRTKDGKRPFIEWIEKLRDAKARYRIEARINKIRAGNFGDWKSVGQGVFELRVDYGPGYRVYFGREGKDIVLLLCGGDKSSQQSDIQLAQRYWAAFKQEGQVDAY